LATGEIWIFKASSLATLAFAAFAAQISEAAALVEFLQAEFKSAPRAVFLARTASKFRLALS